MSKKLAYIILMIGALISCQKNVEPSENQSKSFTKMFGFYGEDNASEVYQTSDGGYIFVGTISTNTYGKDIAVIKTDQFGNEEWSKVYGDTLDNFGNSIKVIGTDYIVCGTTTDTSLTTDIYLLKLDANGNKLWDKTIGSKSSNEQGNDVIRTSDNGFAIVGSTDAEDVIPGPGGVDSVKNAAGFLDFYLIKTTADGTIQWKQNYGANKDDYGTKLIERSSGGYVLLGSSSSFTEYSEYKKTTILGIVVNQNGDISGGYNLFGGRENDFGNDIFEVSDGYIIAGTTSSFTSSGTDMYLAKANSTLTGIEWELNFGSNSNEGANSIIISASDSILVAGYTDDLGTANGDRDQYIVKVSQDGTWDENWGRNFGGIGKDEVIDFSSTEDGGVIFIGTSEFEGVQMINLSKLNSGKKLK